MHNYVLRSNDDNTAADNTAVSLDLHDTMRLDYCMFLLNTSVHQCSIMHMQGSP